MLNTLSHYISQDKRDSQPFTALVNQTVSYSYDLSDSGPYAVGGYSTSADTTAQVGLTLADAPIQIGWSVVGGGAGFVPPMGGVP